MRTIPTRTSCSHNSNVIREVSMFFMKAIWLSKHVATLPNQTFATLSNQRFVRSLNYSPFLKSRLRYNYFPKAVPYHTINSGKRLNCLKAGWEPWSSGYWRRLMFWRLWVQIAVLDTGKTFSHLFKINDVLFDWKDWNKWKETRVGPFKNCLKASLPILLSSA